MTEPLIPIDYTLAYATLARRVAAADALLAGNHVHKAAKELAAAMLCIEQVETPYFIIKGEA
jgi:hypothetical protein